MQCPPYCVYLDSKIDPEVLDTSGVIFYNEAVCVILVSWEPPERQPYFWGGAGEAKTR
jgi:hypothetical protein